MQHRVSWTCAIVAVALVIACERPTAPEARDRAATWTAEMEHGAQRSDWWQFFERADVVKDFADSNSLAVEVIRDGVGETMRGFVLEQVSIPPQGHGRPVSQRTFVAWPPHRKFYVVATTSLDNIEIERAQGFDGRPWLHPKPFVALRHGVYSENWNSREGGLSINSVESSADATPKAVFRTEQSQGSRERVTSEVARYRVSLSAGFVRQGDEERGALAPPPERHHIDVIAQTVPGIRFTTYCSDTLAWWGRPVRQACSSHAIAYWRDKTQFSFDFDPSTLEDATEFAFRITVRGSVFAPPVPQVVRWTIRTPTGSQLERDSAWMYNGETRMPVNARYKELDAIMVLSRSWPGWLGHSRALVAARTFFENAPLFDVVVLDFEFGKPNELIVP